jgi:hypothetical protein
MPQLIITNPSLRHLVVLSYKQPVRSAYQPPVLFSQNESVTSNQPQPASSTLLSEQISHQPTSISPLVRVVVPTSQRARAAGIKGEDAITSLERISLH